MIKYRTVRNRVANLSEEFHLEKGVVKRRKTLEKWLPRLKRSNNKHVAASCYIYTACYASSRFTPARMGRAKCPPFPSPGSKTETHSGHRTEIRKGGLPNGIREAESYFKLGSAGVKGDRKKCYRMDRNGKGWTMLGYCETAHNLILLHWLKGSEEA